MTRQQPESAIVNAILRRLNDAPRTHARTTHGSRYSVGWPDLIGCSDGVMFAIEVKQPGKKATARQAHELAKWRTAGARVGVAHDVAEAVGIVWPMVTVRVVDDGAAPRPGAVYGRYGIGPDA